MRIKLTLADGAEHVVDKVAVADLVAFERVYGVSASKLGEDLKVEHLAFVSHAALTRTGGITMSFEEFVGQLDDVGIEEDPKASAPAPSPVS